MGVRDEGCQRVVGRVKWGGRTHKGNNAPCESTATAYVANASENTHMLKLIIDHTMAGR